MAMSVIKILSTIYCFSYNSKLLPLVLWRCQLGIREKQYMH